MSILANLLSRKKTDDSQENKDIPPTLARSHNVTLPKGISKKRYLALGVIFLVAIVAGLFVTTPKFMKLLVPKPVRYPVPPQPAPTVAQPSPVASVSPELAKQQNEPLPTFITRPVPLVEAKAKKKSVAAKHRHRHSQSRLAAVVPSNLQSHKRATTAQKSQPDSSPEVDPTIKGAHLYAARSSEVAGDWRGALDNYRQALEIDPNNYKIMNNMAAAFNNLGMFSDGAREAKSALARKPDYLPAMVNYAIASSSLGNSTEALRLFSKAHSADPSNKNLAINLGILEERMGRLDEARATYLTLSERGDPQALMGLGRISERKGNKPEAINSYRQILRLRNVAPAVKKEAQERMVRLEE